MRPLRQHMLVEKEPRFQEVLKPFRGADGAWAVPPPFFFAFVYPHPPITYIHPKSLIQGLPPTSNTQTHNIFLFYQ